MNNFTRQYFLDLIENGFEGQDNSNLGGMRVWKELTFGNANSKIVFYEEGVERALKNHRGELYTLGKVLLDAGGNPVKQNGKNQVVNTCLMFYSGSPARDVIASIEEAFPQAIGICTSLENFREQLKENGMLREDGCLDLPENTWPMNFLNMRQPIALENVVFIPFPSGSGNSNKVWGYRSNREQAQQNMARTLQTQSFDDIPF